MRKLEKKGAVAHVERDRIFYYKAVAKQSEVEESTTRDFLDRVYRGSAAGLVCHMLEHESFSQEELEQIRRLIEDQRKKVDR